MAWADLEADILEEFEEHTTRRGDLCIAEAAYTASRYSYMLAARGAVLDGRLSYTMHARRLGCSVVTLLGHARRAGLLTREKLDVLSSPTSWRTEAEVDAVWAKRTVRFSRTVKGEAKRLGMAESTLRWWLKRLGIPTGHGVALTGVSLELVLKEMNHEKAA
jgi:hypothetical protein